MHVKKTTKAKKREQLEFLTKTKTEQLKNKETLIKHNIHRSDNKKLSIENVHEIYHAAKELLGHDKFVVRTIADTGSFTMKSYNGPIILETYDDYMRGKVEPDITAYQDEFYTLQISYIQT